MNKKVFTAAAMFVLVTGIVAMISPVNTVYGGQYGHGHGKGKGNSLGDTVMDMDIGDTDTVMDMVMDINTGVGNIYIIPILTNTILNTNTNAVIVSTRTINPPLFFTPK